MNHFSRYQSPNPVLLSGDPITFKIEYTGGDNPAFDYVGMRMTFTIDGTIYTFEENKQWIGNNIIEFEVHENFNKLIKKSVSLNLSDVYYKVHTDGCTQFTVKYGYRSISTGSWYWETETTPIEDLLDGSSYYVINGKMPEYFLDIMNVRQTDFYQQFIFPKKFLTWQQMEKTISPNQPERLFMYVYDTQYITSMKMLFVVSFENGSQNIEIPFVFEDKRIHEFATGLTDISDLLDTDKGNVLFYRFYILSFHTGEWKTYSETMEYRIDHRTFVNNTLLFYGNDVGGFDILWATGRVVKTVNYTSTKRFKDNRYYNGGQTSGRKLKSTKWEVNVGRKSRVEIAAIEQIMFNNSVFMPINGIMIPVDINDDSTVFDDTDPGFIKVKIAFELAYKETAFGDPNRLSLYDWGEFFNQEFSSEFLI